MATPPASSQYQALSAAIAARAATEAAKVGAASDASMALAQAAATVVRYQAATAAQVPQAASLILSEQGSLVPPIATLQPVAFIADRRAVVSMMETVEREAEDLWTSWQFERLVASLVQDAARVAQQVDIATRPGVSYVRQLAPPSCSRCAVLAGRIYKWNADFDRHPGCDCTALPTMDPERLVHDPADMALRGEVTGLSRADRKALAAGADFNQIANAKRGMQRATIYGRSVQVTTEGTTRRGIAHGRLGKRSGGRDARVPGERYFRTTSVRLTPNEIFRQAEDQEAAVRMLKHHGYVL